MLPAQDGDFFWIRFGRKGEPLHNILIDGGRSSNKFDFAQILKLIYQEKGSIDALFLTHMDGDHIYGMLHGLQQAYKCNEIPCVKKIYINTGAGVWRKSHQTPPSCTILPEDTIKTEDESEEYGIGEGIRLLQFLNCCGLAKQLQDYTSWEESPLKICGATLNLISPGPDQLESFRNNWETFEKERGNTPYGASTLSTESLDILKEKLLTERDTSVNNGSSIAFLFEYQDVRIAFLADAWEDVCIKGLKRFGITPEHPYKVDLFKLPHHGSRFNVSEELIQALPTQNYLLSTNGHGGEVPDKIVISKLLERADNEPVNLYCNYSWWKTSDFKHFFSSQDIEDYLDTKILNLISIGMNSSGKTKVKDGLTLYGKRNYRGAYRPLYCADCE